MLFIRPNVGSEARASSHGACRALFGPACDRSWFETIARELHHQAQHQKNEAKPLIAEIASDFAKQSLYGLLNAVHDRTAMGRGDE